MKVTGKCKDCVFGHFEPNNDGSRKWDGKCYAHLVSEGMMKSHDISQHFNCSNNMFKQRG